MDHIGAVVNDGGTARGRGAVKERYSTVSASRYGSVVGDGCATSRRRAVNELYSSTTAGPINRSHKVLGDPRVVRDTHAADEQNNPRVGSRRKRARTPVEHDPINLSEWPTRDGDADYVGGREYCRVRRPIGRATRCPVGCSVPVPSGRICQPGGAPGKAAARC